MSCNDDDSLLKIHETDVNLFKEIEDDVDLHIPYYLKNLLVHRGFNTKVALAGLCSEDISEMILFAREQTWPPGNENFVDYYGGQSKHNFLILPGHKKLLMIIGQYVKTNMLFRSKRS